VTEFEVVDLRLGSNGERRTGSGHTAEQAATAVLGETVIRSGVPRNLIAKCYFWNEHGAKNMVRFYRSVENAARLQVSA
jgi:hypothetical protein